MSKNANSEQLQAIEHKGGVLLRAGAGSGKTFVLVEHIVYLTRTWINEYKAKPQGNFEDFIRQKYSQVVMMTFTKKAAGEMSIRLTERLLQISSSIEEDRNHWALANDSVPLLLVTTIDGFCKKLISGGYFPHLSTETNVIFDAERTNQVRELVEEWFRKKGRSVHNDLLDIFVREKHQLLSAFTSVFNDPGLRLAWKKFYLDDIRPEKVGELIARSFALNSLGDALAAIESLELPEEKERSAFERNVALFQATGLPVVTDVEIFRIYADLFAPIKSLQPERTESKKDIAHSWAHEGLSKINKWIKVWRPVLADYNEHFDSKVVPWVNLCLELFEFIEDNLDPNQGLTFGDIEYLVLLGLENPADLERVQKTFTYFIVDEFQDTSMVQFRIIRALIGSDFRRLFCVGDAKQAIYGFRGGELSVFNDCAELVPQVKTLSNNYRSLPEVIRFNNSLFRAILPLGQEFEGHDLFTVNSEDQEVPVDPPAAEKGSIEVLSARLELNVEMKKEFSTAEINRLEALMIAGSIVKAREERPGEVCCVLYQRLKPSTELIRALMERKIGFTAQFKIDLLDDPVLGIFLCLLKRHFDGNNVTRDKYPLFLLNSYLSIMGIPREIRLEDLSAFELDTQFWGLIPAFRKFLHRLMITNENSDINLGSIEAIASIYHQDPEAIMVHIGKGNNDRLSLELRSGENSQMVQIMSAHASKGLEFDIVYLGGIFTNGKDKSDSSLFGNLPGSFTWHLDVTKKSTQDSPMALLESEISRYKNFSESKRLLYVACTRAKKKLVWVDFDIQEDTFKPPKNSWIRGLSVWLNAGRDQQDVTFVSHPDFFAMEILSAKILPELPLFFYDPMGILDKGEGKSELGIVPELSVTRLNSLIDCPRKFYLENVLKVSTEEKVYYAPEESEEIGTYVHSSAERGTYLHAQIARGIERNFIVPRESFTGMDKKPVEWTLNILRELKPDFEFIAEKQLKFRFFNFMISGIPDLLLLPKGNQKAQVWDFKTGRITQDNLAHYWLQLSVYAYALFELEKVPKTSTVELVLCFVDEEQLIKMTITWEECHEKLWPLWLSQNRPWEINPEHCSQCCYGDICPR